MKNDIKLTDLHPTVQSFVKGYNFESLLNADHEVLKADITDVMQIASGLVSVSGVSERMQNCFLTGYDKAIKSDGEYYPCGGNGITQSYNGYIIQSAINFADRYLTGETRIEVGMKYPTFNLKKFKKLFNIVKNETVVDYVSSIGGETYYMEIFKDDKGNVFTARPETFSKGGYVGAVFINETEAFKFLDFLLGSAKHYVKDLDIGANGLGGWGITEVDEKLATSVRIISDFDAVAWAVA